MLGLSWIGMAKVAAARKKAKTSGGDSARYKDQGFQEAVGKSFERHRVKKGYSVDRVHLEGEKLSRATISHVDRGMIDAQLSTLKRYAETIGVPLWQIIKDASEGTQ